jgi:hypothetical protein
MLTEMEAKNALKFNCETCGFICSKKSNYNKHLTTLKHKNLTNLLTNSTEKVIKKRENICLLCNKEYKSREGLWYHKKKCDYVKPIEPEKKENPLEMAFLTNLVMEVVKNNAELSKQNHELQKQVLEVCTKNNGTYISHNNSHNKTFNLQVFLNEKCKDAMNIMDFVNSMTLELSDLEDVGTLGYVEGISNIIIRKLGELDIYKRPIHCSDGKREIMYVKDDNVWEKENDTNDKLRMAIKHVTYKNSSLLVPWSQKHPNCMNIQHHLNDVYVRMIGQAMGGKEEFVDSENKIMKKIAKTVLIDKSC